MPGEWGLLSSSLPLSARVGVFLGSQYSNQLYHGVCTHIQSSPLVFDSEWHRDNEELKVYTAHSVPSLLRVVTTQSIKEGLTVCTTHTLYNLYSPLR
jgi:hypothetical protein